jgi:hypothetical protein
MDSDVSTLVGVMGSSHLLSEHPGPPSEPGL